MEENVEKLIVALMVLLDEMGGERTGRLPSTPP